MRKLKLFALCFASLALVFTACDKGDEDIDGNDGNGGITNNGDGNGDGNGGLTGNVIQVNIANGASYDVDSVFITDYWEIEVSPGEYLYGEDILARAAYNQGNFSITLPENLDAKYLENADDMFDGEMTVSNAEVKLSEAYTLEAYKNEEFVGTIELTDNADLKKATEAAMFIYSDGSVQISGEDIYEYDEYDESEYTGGIEKLNVSLVKGWNVIRVKIYIENNYKVYEYKAGNTDGLTWYFIEDSYYKEDPESEDDYNNTTNNYNVPRFQKRNLKK